MSANRRYLTIACRQCGAGEGVMCKSTSGRAAAAIHAGRIAAFVEKFNATALTQALRKFPVK